MAAHPGFKAVQKKIAGQGHSMANAGAILAAASRGASKSAKAKNPRLNRVKGKMHEGGEISESGLYEMQKGEIVVAAPHKSLPSTYASEGSHPHSNNPKRYIARNAEMKECDVDKDKMLSETDHKFAPSMRIDNQILSDSPEMVRRINSRNRDYRTGNRITNNGIYANPVSPSGDRGGADADGD